MDHEQGCGRQGVTGDQRWENEEMSERASRDRPATNPGGVECRICERTFVGEEWHNLCAICEPKLAQLIEGRTEEPGGRT